MREKTFKNTPNGRLRIPARSGEYVLLDRFGNEICSWMMSNNLERSIKEKHYDKTKVFSYVRIRTGRI